MNMRHSWLRWAQHGDNLAESVLFITLCFPSTSCDFWTTYLRLTYARAKEGNDGFVREISWKKIMNFNVWMGALMGGGEAAESMKRRGELWNETSLEWKMKWEGVWIWVIPGTSMGLLDFLWDDHHLYSYLMDGLLTIGKRISDPEKGKMDDNSNSRWIWTHLLKGLCFESGEWLNIIASRIRTNLQWGCVPPWWDQVWRICKGREKDLHQASQAINSNVYTQTQC